MTISGMSVTLADIARKTGYSVNTISHALNDKPDISKKTKEYIVKTADEMGYIPNSYASAMRSGKSKSVAIIVGDISNPHFSIMIKEMENKLKEYGYTAIVFNTDESSENEKSAVISAISKNVDGIIICPTQKNASVTKLLNKQHIPYIFFGRNYENDNSNYVVCDDFKGGYSAADYLIKLKHTQILYINTNEYISSAKKRRQGIIKAFVENNIPVSNLIVKEIDTKSDTASIEQVLNQEKGKFSAIICFSDFIALEVMYLVRKSGLNIPDDISVVGFDNIASRYHFPILLTSVSTSKTKMSLKSVDTLVGLINKELTAPQQHILPTKLIARESTCENKHL